MTIYHPPEPFSYESAEVGYGYLRVHHHDKNFQVFNKRLPQASDFQAVTLNSIQQSNVGVEAIPPKVYKVRFRANLGMAVVSTMQVMMQFIELKEGESVLTQKAIKSIKSNPSGIFACKDYTLKSAVTYLLHPQQVVLSFEQINP